MHRQCSVSGGAEEWVRLGLSDPQGNEVLELNPKSSFLKGNGGPKASAFV